MGAGPIGMRNALEEMAGGWYATDDQPKANEDADRILEHVGELSADTPERVLQNRARRAAAVLSTDLDEQDEIAGEIVDALRSYWRAEAQRVRAG